MMQYHIIVHGRVQGVLYRDFVRKNAEILGVTGWAKNLPDGSVEVMAEGEKESIEELLQKLRIGPDRAVVEHLEVDKWKKDGREYSDFEIIY